MSDRSKTLSVSRAAALCGVGRITVGYWIRTKPGKVFLGAGGAYKVQFFRKIVPDTQLNAALYADGYMRNLKRQRVTFLTYWKDRKIENMIIPD